MKSKEIQRIFLLNTPEAGKLVNRDMAGGLGFDRKQTTVLPPLDLLAYATYLEDKGFSVRLLDSQVECMTSDEIKDEVCRFAPDTVILTVSLPTIAADISFLKSLRNDLSSTCEIIPKTGIRHRPTLEKLLRQSECELCITGECDLTIDEILERRSRAGTAYILDDRFCEENEATLVELDDLPILKRELLKTERYFYSRFGAVTTTMQTSRGCPFSCAYYCPYPLVQGKKWRAMTAERILREIKSILHEHRISNVLFRDATFTLNKKRIREFCRSILDEGLSFSWWCETRIDCLDRVLLDMMQQSGCKGINVGIESGDIAMLSKIAKEGVQLKDIVEITRYCAEIGIKLHYLLMVGLPGENKDSLFETFKLVDQMAPESVGITTATPYPGTQLYADAMEQGWIVESNYNTFGGHGYNLLIEPLTTQDLSFARERIYEVSRLRVQKSEAAERRRLALYAEFESWRKEKITEGIS